MWENEFYSNANNPIMVAESKWYDHKAWIPLISSSDFQDLQILKPQKAVPIVDPTILKQLGIQHISCNSGSTQLLPYHVLVFKAAHVYYGDTLPQIADPRGFLQMAFSLSLKATNKSPDLSKYPTFTENNMYQMKSKLQKYGLSQFVTPLSALVFPPMSDCDYDYDNGKKEFKIGLKMIKREYPEVYTAIALINYVAINGVDCREAYPRVLRYDGSLERFVNTVAEGEMGFEVLELSPHFRRRTGIPRRKRLNAENNRKDDVDIIMDTIDNYCGYCGGPGPGPSKKKQKASTDYTSDEEMLLPPDRTLRDFQS